MNSYASNAVAASASVIWEYCTTFDDEIELIWRQKWSWITIVFSIIRYVPIISSNLIFANILGPFFRPSSSSCVAWAGASLTWASILVICYEALLIIRVYALYAQHRLLLYGLITLCVCVNMARIILLAIIIPQLNFGEDVDVHTKRHSVACIDIRTPSINYAALVITEYFPATVFFLLAVIKLIHTKRTTNIAVSRLLVVIVRDGTWVFALFLAFSIWNVLQLELGGSNRGLASIWVVPVAGFISSRLILNLRFSANAPLGGTSVQISDIKFASIDAT